MESIRENHINTIGYTGAFLASLILWPLAYKTLKTQDVEGLSPYTIVIQLAASCVWFFYGWLKSDYPLMIVQTSLLISNLAIAYFYIKFNAPKAYNKLLNKEF